MKKKIQILLALIIGVAMGFGFILPNWNILAQDEVTVTITSSANDPTNTSPIPVEIEFKEEVTGFEKGQILFENVDVDATTFNTEDNIVYELDIIPVDEGEVTVFVPAGVAEDADENTNDASEQFSITYDITPPTVEITTELPTDPTGRSPIPITLTFSEPVLGFGYSDIEITNGDSVGGDLQTDEVKTILVEPDHFGDVTVTITSMIISDFTDLAGNAFDGTEIFEIEYVNEPRVWINQAKEQLDPTSEEPILFTVLFSEDVTGFDDPVEDVNLEESTAPGDMTAVITGEGDTYTVSVSGMTDDGLVIASIPVGAAEDDIGNTSFVSESVDNEVEYIAPPATIISIERLDLSPTKAVSVNFLVTFSEAVKEVDEDDFDVHTTSELIGASVSQVLGSGETYVVTVLTGSGHGALRLDVGAEAEIFNLDDEPIDEEALPYEDGEIYFVRIQSFSDVPTSNWAWQWIERLYNAGVTTGCSQIPLNYCPDGDVTRAEMAKFLLAALYGEGYEPPALGVGEDTGFDDVPSTYWAAAWIKKLADDGITSGCGGGNYCPNAQVTRAEMAKFLLTAKNGSGYTPPELGIGDLTGFTDVPVNYWAAEWIKQLAVEGLTDGCAPELYCPEAKVSRAEMAKFLVSTFELP